MRNVHQPLTFQAPLEEVRVRSIHSPRSQNPQKSTGRGRSAAARWRTGERTPKCRRPQQRGRATRRHLRRMPATRVIARPSTETSAQEPNGGAEQTPNRRLTQRQPGGEPQRRRQQDDDDAQPHNLCKMSRSSTALASPVKKAMPRPGKERRSCDWRSTLPSSFVRLFAGDVQAIRRARHPPHGAPLRRRRWHAMS